MPPYTPYGAIPPWMRQIGGGFKDLIGTGAGAVGEAGAMAGRGVRDSMYGLGSELQEAGALATSGTLGDISNQVTGYGAAIANPAFALGQAIAPAPTAPVNDSRFSSAIRAVSPQSVPAGPAPVTHQNAAAQATADEQAKSSGAVTRPDIRTNNMTSGGDSANPAAPMVREYKPGITWSGQTAAERGGVGNLDGLRRGAVNQDSPQPTYEGGYRKEVDGQVVERQYGGPQWGNYAATSGSQQEVDRGIKAERDDRYFQQMKRIDEQTALNDPRREQIRRALEDATLAQARYKAQDPSGLGRIGAEADVKNSSFLRIEAGERAKVNQKIAAIQADLSSDPATKAAAIKLAIDDHEQAMKMLQRYAPRVEDNYGIGP